jgi:predicted ArsR family transcriptional regulator
VFLVDALEGIAQPELREIVLFARSRSRPVSADDVSARFHVHRSVARSRLDRLAEAGLLTVGFERRTGRSGPGAGRPAKIYSVPPETASLEFPDRHYDRLFGRLLDTVPAEERAVALNRVGAEFARDLVPETAGRELDPRAAAEAACEALGRLGFQARVEEVADGRVTISTPTCPMRPLVVANPEAAAIDRGMWAELTGASSCETCDCLDHHASCKVVLEFDRD